jgi:hypothetical protein
MAEETDGVREAFDDALRVALTVATQLGERGARLREQFGRQREARAFQANRELEARFEAERGAMRASLLPIKQHGWWEGASVTDIANARETAVAWSDFDDVARETNDTIEREVQERYGVEVRHPGANPAEVREANRTAENERAQAIAERERDGEELAEADRLLRAADRRDREAADGSDRDQAVRPGYDTAARRGELVASLAAIAAPETIAARILADGENAKHPTEAVLVATTRTGKLQRRSSRGVKERDIRTLPGR